MGGLGSGRRSDGYGRNTAVEDCARIDADRTNGQLFEWPGFMISWWRETLTATSYKMSAKPGHGGPYYRTVEVEVVEGKRPYSQTLALQSAPTPLGGLRWWWECPRCAILRKHLYCRPGEVEFACRVCLELTYASRQQHHRSNGLDRLIFGDLGRKGFEAAVRYEDAQKARCAYRRAKRSRRKLMAWMGPIYTPS